MDTAASRKIRSACDSCHNMKMKCSGGQPCMTCKRYKHTCTYSAPNRIGRPKGSKNKTTTSPATRAALSKDTVETEIWNWDQPQSPLLMHDGRLNAPTVSPSDDSGLRSPLASLSEHDLHATSIPLYSMGLCAGDPELGLSSDPLGLLDDTHSLSPAYLPSPTYPPLPLPSIAPPLSMNSPNIPWKNCNCVGVQAETLSSLRKREAGPCPIAFPIVLEATQDIQIRWEALFSCSLCRLDSDHVALLLLAMSLRPVLRWLQLLIYDRVSLSCEPPGPSKHTPQRTRGLSHGTMSSMASPESIDNGARSTTRLRGGSGSRSGNSTGERLRIGIYDLPDDEHDFLLDMLTSRTLGKLKGVQTGITAYFQQSQSTLSYTISGEKKSIHTVLDHLRHSIETTETLLETLRQKVMY
ncbi:uncharacterized protein BO97DRAFT_451197 [Aspergillus homomorphus CBS 101889]|uniref:Zn(2)-C6 fungal-type domain-containing protein n=1 Tax=Aspergillus homomorphus (strain CBS 101889) TaxID=1450537 RepID=A0A395I0H2_ASPHC|nr:hypothetical protein BO97DRAFT_451197 [Aspergillus homomorphus CBS 101889]RAL12638.1 hypothetical protein BO97DRAFT_451197 [Aspergillus homomorphus CBS 101889]